MLPVDSDGNSLFTPVKDQLTGVYLYPVNAIQQLRVDATGGTYSLSFGGQTTAPLAYNISGLALQSALMDSARSAPSRPRPSPAPRRRRRRVVPQIHQGRDPTIISYTVVPGDTPATMASGLLSVSNNAILTNAGFTSSVSGNVLSFDSTSGGYALSSTVTGANRTEAISAATNVQVTQAGNLYRISFGNALAGAAQPLIETHDFGLTNGNGQTNTLTVNDSGFGSPQVAVLTATTLSFAGDMLVSATVGGTSPSVGDVIKFVFTTGINTTESVSYTVASGDTAASIAAGLRDKFNLDQFLLAKGYSFSVSGSTVNIQPADAGPYFPWQVQITGKNTETVTANAAADWVQPNTIQELHLDATSGSFALAFNGFPTTTSDGTTAGLLPWNVSAANLQAALEALPSIGKGNIAVSKNDDVYVLRFQGTLTNRQVTPITVASSTLARVIETADGTPLTTNDTTTNAAGSTALIQIFSREPGSPNPPIDDVQTLTINATGGTYTLALPGRGGATNPIPFDASAERVRSELQFAMEANINKTDVEVAKYGNTYIIYFEGQLRDQNGGSPIPLLIANATNLTGGGLTVATRWTGIQLLRPAGHEPNARFEQRRRAECPGHRPRLG